MINIDKGIAIPLRKESVGIYPLKKMNIGDSFFFPAEDSNLEKKRKSVIANAYHYCPLMKFTTRKVIENEKLGIRVWRIS